MTEKEKMLAGQWYNANFDASLIEERAIVKDLCLEFNRTPMQDLSRRRKILREILPHVDSEAVEILSPFMVDYGYNIYLGAGTFLNHNCYFMDCAEIRFGKKVFVGPNCGFYTAIHPLDIVRRAEGLEMAKPIVIGDDVWLGGDVTILPGVTIGSGSVIGAKSLVTKDIPSNVMAFGNPARVIKKIGMETLLV
ncbi:MAG: sugar O-acetyltransferase [Selenomonadaceae bacterium]|nr:sugar O-acetyltransferase [Selenomonadaceae bacterium]